MNKGFYRYISSLLSFLKTYQSKIKVQKLIFSQNIPVKRSTVKSLPPGGVSPSRIPRGGTAGPGRDGRGVRGNRGTRGGRGRGGSSKNRYMSQNENLIWYVIINMIRNNKNM